MKFLKVQQVRYNSDWRAEEKAGEWHYVPNCGFSGND